MKGFYIIDVFHFNGIVITVKFKLPILRKEKKPLLSLSLSSSPLERIVAMIQVSICAALDLVFVFSFILSFHNWI